MPTGKIGAEALRAGDAMAAPQARSKNSDFGPGHQRTQRVRSERLEFVSTPSSFS